MSYVGVHRKQFIEAASAPVERHRSTRAALASFFVLLSLCASLSLLRLNVGTPGGGSIDRWTFGSGELRIAMALDGFDVLRHGGNESPLALTSRGLTLGTASETNSATYLQRRMPGTVNRIGATAYFEPALPGATGQVALLVSASPLSTDASKFLAEVPNMAIHFVFDSETWFMSVWRHQGGQDVLGVGRFATPLLGERSVEVIRRDDEVSIALPNGESVNFRDPRIASWSSEWATWELYEKGPGIKPAVLTQIWAGWEK
ncbi:hypothetical protein H7K45_15535 [Mycobacterium yunnanensis]|uniref:Uncharacterized protein n=1 Tax=Mycobacterium yunnanensis TaxID=368477 RepID=A0A9X2Z3Q9_9MYCO|nr:hypothetical protein [Mycobacterium yunnanensis]MCV7421961.1 hypothetical protein [Mycobacterium yunnanensis]